MNVLDGTLGLHERSQLTLNNGLTCTNTTTWEFGTGIRDPAPQPVGDDPDRLLIPGHSRRDIIA